MVKRSLSKIKMNNHKSDKDNNKKKVPQMSIKLLDGSIIKFSLSSFYDVIERECINYILGSQNRLNIIDPNDMVHSQNWKKKFKALETQVRMLDSIASRLKRDLTTNKFAQPIRCLSASVNQHVVVTVNIQAQNMARDAARDALNNSEKKYPIFTISDSEDDDIITDTSKIKPMPTKNANIIDIIDLDDDTQNLDVKYKPAPKLKTNCKSYSEDDDIITDTSKIKPIPTKNANIIDMIDLDDDTQNLEVKSEPALKSKTNVSTPDLKTNVTNKVLPINSEAGKTLSNGEFLSTTIYKRKPGPKSKTMFVSDMVPFNTENEETPAKKMRLNECKVINNKESNTKKLLSSNSSKKVEVLKKCNYYLKSSSLDYPPPYPLIPPHNNQPSWKNVPPIPNMTIKVSGNKVTLTWDLNVTWQTAKIKMYELFVCQESDAPPNASMWKKKGNIEADLLPMACELEVFELGHIYYFALRAVDIHDRRAPCAVQKTKI